MSSVAQTKILVLWEHEIRLAAKLIAASHQAFKEGGNTDAACTLLFDAMNACAAALHGADDPDVSLVLSAVPALTKKAKKKS